ncbi:MAG: hypothetical protein ACR2O0_03010 [Rhizobiaceae bacterium]
MIYSAYKARQGITSSNRAITKVVIISTSLAFISLFLIANTI